MIITRLTRTRGERTDWRRARLPPPDPGASAARADMIGFVSTGRALSAVAGCPLTDKLSALRWPQLSCQSVGGQRPNLPPSTFL